MVQQNMQGQTSNADLRQHKNKSIKCITLVFCMIQTHMSIFVEKIGFKVARRCVCVYTLRC